MNPGLIGGVVGTLVGVAGGAVGTWCSIKNTNGPLERTFMIRASVMMWVFALVFIALLFLIPAPYGWMATLPFSLMLPLLIVWGNRKQQQIRSLESTLRKGADEPGE
ncbi:hypothetical protein [Kiritimatiella glycovorans]|uniref:Uncharacterized protein n=1 Tax=Kiritimatiella glycovorans TaxID=1307763 RepID=A0A0G3EJL2_9BACT|nr:hypothetical protein [Kiritimatiella glycovorans]AKJ64314.1 hypothetical protein L21SP4_01060 [Kiritimatiella glycovorans]